MLMQALRLTLAVTFVASATASEASAPPPAPSHPAVIQPIDWSLLCAVLGGAYTVVMILVGITVCTCWRRRQSGQQAGAAQLGVVIDDNGQAMGPISVRRVQRDNSWMSKRNASPSYDLSTIDRSIKMGFVRKVYSILATQLLLTCVIIVGFIYGSFTPDENGAPDPNTLSELGMWVFSNASWFILVSLIPIIAIICMLRSYKNQYPCNYIMLFTFTIFESITLGMVCVFYYAAGFGDQILLAAAITLGIFLVLTLYTMQSKIDWSFLGPALITCLFVMIFWSWFTFWLSPANSFTGRKVISLFGAIIFSLFIIYDTNNIMKHFGVDDYIIAAIELYLDVINLFQYLLMLLSSSNN